MTHDDVAAIEASFVEQWASFGRGPGGAVRNEDGLTWVEAPVSQLPYNAVLRTRLSSEVDENIDRCIDRFRRRGVHFMWIAHPSAQPQDLDARLKRRGLAVIEQGTGMALDVAKWTTPQPARPGITYREVTDQTGLEAYEHLIAAYWELAEETRSYVLGINRWAFEERLGVRWVAYKDDRPIGKAYLSWQGFPDTAAIFGVYVGPDARGYGIATQLTALAVERAADEGRERVVLHSSAMAHQLYERIGFMTRCDFPAYGTHPLHSLQPS